MNANQEAISKVVKALRGIHKYGQLSDIAAYIDVSYFQNGIYLSLREKFFAHYLYKNITQEEKSKFLEIWTDEIVYAAQQGWITADSFKNFDKLGYYKLFPYIAFARLLLTTNDPAFIAIVENENLFFSHLKRLRSYSLWIPESEKTILRALIFKAIQKPLNANLFEKLGEIYAKGDDLRQRLSLRLGWIAVICGAADKELVEHDIPINNYLYALIGKIISTNIPKEQKVLYNIVLFASALRALGLHREKRRVMAFLYAEQLNAINSLNYLYVFPEQESDEKEQKRLLRSLLLRFLRSNMIKNNSIRAINFFDIIKLYLRIPSKESSFRQYLLSGLGFFENQAETERRVIERKLVTAWITTEILRRRNDLGGELMNAIKDDAKLIETIILGAQEALNLLPKEAIRVLKSTMMTLEPLIVSASSYVQSKYRELMSAPAAQETTHVTDEADEAGLNGTTRSSLPEPPSDAYKSAFNNLLEEYAQVYINKGVRGLRKFLNDVLTPQTQDPELVEMYNFFCDLIGISDRDEFYIPACYNYKNGFMAVHMGKKGELKTILLPNSPIGYILRANGENNAFVFSEDKKKNAEEQAMKCAKRIDGAVPILLIAKGIRDLMSSTEFGKGYRSSLNVVLITNIENLEMNMKQCAIKYLTL